MPIFRFFLGLLCLAPLFAYAGGDAAAGKASATTCGACHGQNGVAIVPGAPNLAGQNERYLVAQLKAIKSGTRSITLMAGQLDQMSETDLDNLAAYFASLPAPVGQAAGDQLKQGQQIYRGGIADKGVAACTACHSPTGSGNSLAGFPHLGGQRSDYIVTQLTAYREGKRVTDESYGGMMRGIAGGLTDTEIQAVASYIQGLH
jgi:cytochrome c553